MSTEQLPCPFDTEFMEDLGRMILQNLKMATDQPIGLHILVVAHGVSLKVSNIEPDALIEELQRAIERLHENKMGVKH